VLFAEGWLAVRHRVVVQIALTVSPESFATIRGLVRPSARQARIVSLARNALQMENAQHLPHSSLADNFVLVDAGIIRAVSVLPVQKDERA